MTERRALRRIHLVSTIWFTACIVYVLVWKLWEAGFQWWLIFSLSGPSALYVFLLISLYLFALYRGIDETQRIEVEHPLTTSSYYMALYVAVPVLGGLASTLAMMGETKLDRCLLWVAVGTLYTTSAMWIAVDPAVGLIEMLLPASRRHRTERLAQAEAQRRARQEKREHLLAEAFAREERQQQQWREQLQGAGARLAALLAHLEAEGLAQAEQEAVDIGAQAWRLGGLVCMRQLHEMTIQTLGKIGPKTPEGEHDTVSSSATGLASSGSRRSVLGLPFLLVGRHRRLAETLLELRGSGSARSAGPGNLSRPSPQKKPPARGDSSPRGRHADDRPRWSAGMRQFPVGGSSLSPNRPLGIVLRPRLKSPSATAPADALASAKSWGDRAGVSAGINVVRSGSIWSCNCRASLSSLTA